jgi:ribose/xylose/arabinose/galactoside ABC-type transport system permease subunit
MSNPMDSQLDASTAPVHEKKLRSIEEGITIRNFWQSAYTPGLVLLLVAIVFFSLLTKGQFLNPDNLVTLVLVFFLEFALVTIGMTLVILVRGIDLSIGGIIGLVSVVLGVTLKAGIPTLIAILIGLLVGTACGILNGVLVTRFRTPAIIATLGSGIMFYGIAIGASGGQPYMNLPDSFAWFANGKVLGIPAQVIIFLAIVVISHVTLSHTRFGRWVYASGGNATAAKFSGIQVKRVVLAIYAISGLLAAVSGVIICSRYYSAKGLYGQGIELTLITAALLGGVNIAGGEGTILGAVLGMLVIAIVQNGLILAGVHSTIQGVTIGVLVILVMLVNRFLAQRRVSA